MMGTTTAPTTPSDDVDALLLAQVKLYAKGSELLCKWLDAALAGEATFATELGLGAHQSYVDGLVSVINALATVNAGLIDLRKSLPHTPHLRSV